MKSKANKNLGPLSKVLNNPFFKNPLVLYFVALVVFLQLIFYLLNGKFTAIVFFYIVSLITFQFNKNMTIVLGLPAILTYLVHIFLYRNSDVIEGLENKESEEDAVEVDETIDEDADDDTVDEDLNAGKLDLSDASEEEKQAYSKNSLTPSQIKAAFAGTNPKAKDVKKAPGLYNIPNKEQIKKQMKEADKIEEAYDNLEKVIGQDGIKSMSSNTKELVEQQKQLITGLKEVAPALDQAVGALGKIDMGKIIGIFNNMNPAK